MNIEIKNLCKAFGEKVVFKNFSCTLPAGCVTCLEGASGIGKTTLLRILMGLETADSGTIIGLEDKHVAAVFQEDRLCDNLSAVSNVKMVCAEAVPRAAIEEELGRLGLAESMHQPVRELSGGMRQRVALARAVMAEHNFILLDEPFSALDEAAKEQVIMWLLEKIKGKTAVMVSHDKADCRRMGAGVVNIQ